MKEDRTRTDDEIIEDIITYSQLKAGCSKSRAVDLLHRKIGQLRKVATLKEKMLDRKANREHAANLLGAINKLEALLAAAPQPLGYRLFWEKAEPDFPRLPRMNLDKLEWWYESVYVKSFLGRLKAMRETCDRAINPGFGVHPNYGFSEELCVRAAHDWMKEMSGRRISSSSSQSPFRLISGLFFEAVGGTFGRDMERICKRVLKDIRTDAAS